MGFAVAGVLCFADTVVLIHPAIAKPSTFPAMAGDTANLKLTARN
jgi:hypothetical protein